MKRCITKSALNGKSETQFLQERSITRVADIKKNKHITPHTRLFIHHSTHSSAMKISSGSKWPEQFVIVSCSVKKRHLIILTWLHTFDYIKVTGQNLLFLFLPTEGDIQNETEVTIVLAGVQR